VRQRRRHNGGSVIITAGASFLRWRHYLQGSQAASRSRASSTSRGYRLQFVGVALEAAASYLRRRRRRRGRCVVQRSGPSSSRRWLHLRGGTITFEAGAASGGLSRRL
jgi:hypothetical protein